MPLALILIPYGLLLIVFAVLSLFNLFHLIRFGSLNFFSFFVTAIFLAVTVLILFLTSSALTEVSWTAPLLELGSRPSPLGI